MRRKIWAGFALSALAAAQLAAGVVYEIEVKDHEQSPPRTSATQIEVEGRHLKIGIAPSETGGAGGDAIWRGDRREMLVVDHDDRSYMVIDEEMIASLASQVGGVMSQIDEALKNVPSDQRAAVEQMMKQRMPQPAPKPPAAEIERTSERAKKNGYPCVKYIVRVGGRETRQLWVTDWNNVEGGDEVVAVFRDMADFFREMMKSIQEAAGGLPGGMPGGLGDGFLSELSELDGLPVVTEEIGGDGALESESVLRSSRRQKLDPAGFEPPAGYKRRSMMGQ